MYKNKLRAYLEHNGIRQADLSRVAQISNITLYKLAKQEIEGTPSTRARVVNGLNYIIAQQVWNTTTKPLSVDEVFKRKAKQYPTRRGGPLRPGRGKRLPVSNVRP